MCSKKGTQKLLHLGEMINEGKDSCRFCVWVTPTRLSLKMVSSCLYIGQSSHVIQPQLLSPGGHLKLDSPTRHSLRLVFGALVIPRRAWGEGNMEGKANSRAHA